MSCFLALLFTSALALSLTHPASAQTPAEGPAAELDDPSALLTTPPRGVARSPRGERDDPVARAFFGPLAGLGMIALGTVVGAAVGSGITCGDPEDDSICGALFTALGAAIGAGVGLAVLYPLGVALGANAAGGRGDAGWTYLRGLIGAAVGASLVLGALGIHVATGADSAALIISAIVLGAGAAMVGPVIAYEITDHASRTSARTETSWLPTLTVGPHGASAGVVGSF